VFTDIITFPFYIIFRFDEEAGKVELDYPRDMSMWKGVPYNIDAVFQHDNGIIMTLR